FIDSRLTGPTSPDAVMQEYGRRPLDFEPGSFYSYSNTGFLIAARIVEEVTGEPFMGFLSRSIFEPLRMERTGVYRLEGPGLVERTTTYFGGQLEPAVPESPGWLLGAGGLMSTPEDLAKWSLGLMSGAVLA